MTHVTGHYVEEVEERIDDYFQGNPPSTLLKGEHLEKLILDLYANDNTAFAVVHVGCKPWIFLEERQQLSPCLT